MYYDTARTGGVGGKANSKKGGNKAMFGSDMRMVATAIIEEMEEIFVDYGSEYEWEGLPEDREGWEYVRRGARGNERQGGGPRRATEREGETEEGGGGTIWKWVREVLRRGRWKGGDTGGCASEDEGEEGGDREGDIGEEGEDGGETESGRGGKRSGKGRILQRAPMGLRLRWMVEGKGPPWAQR